MQLYPLKQKLESSITAMSRFVAFCKKKETENKSEEYCRAIAESSQAQFSWTKFALEEEEKRFIETKDIQSLLPQNGQEFSARYVLSFCEHKFTCFKRELEALQKEALNTQLTFENEFFKITPEKGEIWPNSSIEFAITFLPQFEQQYTAVAYCDVAGKEQRLPLYLKVAEKMISSQ